MPNSAVSIGEAVQQTKARTATSGHSGHRPFDNVPISAFVRLSFTDRCVLAPVICWREIDAGRELLGGWMFPPQDANVDHERLRGLKVSVAPSRHHMKSQLKWEQV